MTPDELTGVTTRVINVQATSALRAGTIAVALSVRSLTLDDRVTHLQGRKLADLDRPMDVVFRCGCERADPAPLAG